MGEEFPKRYEGRLRVGDTAARAAYILGMTKNTDSILRKKATGEPTRNGGHFGTHHNSTPDCTLSGVKFPKRGKGVSKLDQRTLEEIYGDTLPMEVEPENVEVDVFQLDGVDVHIGDYVTDHGDHYYQVWGDPVVADVDVNSLGDKITPKYLREAAASAYDQACIDRLHSKRGKIPALDDQLAAEINRLSNRIKTRTRRGLTTPEDWDGSYELHSAASRMDERLDGGQYGTDPINARCDYAEVSEEGIAYGYNIPSSLIGEILVGEQGVDEDDYDYQQRIEKAGSREDLQTLEKFFTDEYGAELMDFGLDDPQMSVEFFVTYGKEGPKHTSIEAMGDRAEKETKLLDLRNSYEAGGDVQHRLAAALGYEFDGTIPISEDGTNQYGRFVRRVKTAA